MDQLASSSIFAGWEPQHSQVWGNQPVRLEHRLADSGLFTREALADLIERYPQKMYTLVHMGAQKGKKFWRYGMIGDMDGKGVIRAIEAGRLWINLLHVNEVDPRYGKLLDLIFSEIETRVPGFGRSFDRINGILISSPRAQVYYHFDAMGQSLWQIEGQKTVYVYPPVPPFLTRQTLEYVALYRDEVGVAYEAWYDQYAIPYELHPGQMMHWPLNAPHRVENGDELSVSMTAEYFTDAIRRKMMLNMANGLIRQKLGIEPGIAVNGPAFWTKAAMQAALRRTGLLKTAREERLQLTFKLDPTNPGQIIDLVEPPQDVTTH